MPSAVRSFRRDAARIVLPLAFALAAPHLAFAQAAQSQAVQSSDDPNAFALPEVIVSATGLPTPESEIASSVSLVTAADIERRQQRTVPEVLQSLPGLNVVQTGGPGGQTSVFIRGTNSNHVKVLLDGVDIGNPSSPNGAFDFGQLLASDLDRVEVLRGPQSGLYGSDAIGGVIALTTKKGNGPAKITGYMEGGAYGTFNQAASLSGSTDRLAYSFNVTHFSANDIKVTPQYLTPPGTPNNPNATDNWTYSTRLDYAVTDTFDVNVVARYISSQLAYTPDVYPPPTYEGMPAAQQSLGFSRQFFTKGEGVWRTFDDRLTTTFGVSALTATNPTVGPNSDYNSTYDGDRQVYYLRSNLLMAPGQNMLVGLERRNESITSSTAYSQVNASTGDSAAYAEYQGNLAQRLFFAANVRYDSDDSFGDHTTFRLAPALIFPETGTKLKASYGTGFKAPTLYQLYQPIYGNADLLPEESTGWDAGFEQSLLNGKLTFGATYFYNDITNLISYDPATYQNVNISSAVSQGVEAFVAVAVTDQIDVRVDYTYTNVVGYVPIGLPFGAACAPIDLTSCNPLRRPNNKVSVTLGWRPTDTFDIAATLVYASSWWDVVRLTSDYIDQPGYTVVNLAANWKVTQNATVFGRINNLFDQTYENPNGFLAPGFGAIGGVRFTY